MALSEEKIEQIKVDFEAQKMSLSDVSKKHEVSRGTLYRLAKQHGWRTKQRKSLPKPKPKPKRGRPPKYDKTNNSRVTALCLLGYNNAQIAEFFDISEETFYTWRKEHPDFSDAITSGREDAGMKAAVSLFKRVTGYDYTETKDVYEGEELVKKEQIKKRMAPDVKAILIFLKHHFGDFWKDKQDVDLNHGGQQDGVGKITIELVSSENKNS